MNVQFKSMCRGDGKAYVLTEISGYDERLPIVLATTTSAGVTIPSDSFPYCDEDDFEAIEAVLADGALARTAEPEEAVSIVRRRSTDSDTRMYVVVLPLLPVKRWVMEFRAINSGGIVVANCRKTLDYEALKWMSRFNYRVHGEEVESFRDIDRRFTYDHIAVDFRQLIEDGEEAIVRACVEIPYHEDSIVEFDYLDASGARISVPACILEDDVSAVNLNGMRQRRSVMLSLRIPKNSQLCLCATDTVGFVSPGFGMLDDASYAFLRDRFNELSLSAQNDPEYDAWYRRHRADMPVLLSQVAARMPYQPLMSIIVPLFNTPVDFLTDMIDSVRAQSYARWELILVNASPENTALAAALESLSDDRIFVIQLEENKGIAENTNEGLLAAEGEFVCFLDHDDKLAPEALFEYVQALNETPDTDVIYCDEDSFDEYGNHHNPFFKPDYSPELLTSHNYITHFLAVRSTLITEVGLLSADFDGAQDYDLVLRSCEKARTVTHVPQVLYHWRLHEDSTSANPESKLYASDAGRRALVAHCSRVGMHAEVLQHPNLPFAYRLQHICQVHPTVSIIIPNKDQVELLKTCVGSLFHRVCYDKFEVIIVENNSTQPETFEYYEDVQAKHDNVRVVTWEDEFNFSKVVNYGVQQSESDFVLLLNNDTKVITPDFMETMLGFFQSPEVGVVGAKLLFRDGTVQHGGVSVGAFGRADHLFQFLPDSAPGYFDRAQLTQNLSAVTGACQMIRRSVYEEVEGYNPEFRVGYNDVDFCLKVRGAGYRVVFTPHAKLFHYEFASRGRDVSRERRLRVEQEEALLHMRWPSYFVDGDPYLNPNLNRDSLYFGLADRN